MKLFYQEKIIDIFKDGVSLPGQILKYLMNSTDSKFSLFEQEDKDLYGLLICGIVGWPSKILKGYVEAGKTHIRNGNKVNINYVIRLLDMMQMHYIYGLYLNGCQQEIIKALNHMI